LLYSGTKVQILTWRKALVGLRLAISRRFVSAGETQHTSAYVSIRQHTSEPQHTSAYVSSLSIRQHTSAYVSMRQSLSIRQLTSAASAYVSIRQQPQHISAYVSIRQHTSAYVSIRRHTSADLDVSCPQVRLTAGRTCSRLLLRPGDAVPRRGSSSLVVSQVH
jgi:hypothetical protein